MYLEKITRINLLLNAYNKQIKGVTKNKAEIFGKNECIF